MATYYYMALLVLINMTVISAAAAAAAALASATSSVYVTEKSQDLVVATEEMEKATYFTFVMLLNMSPLDQRLQGNLTFLMPKDRMLSKIQVPRDAVSDFLLRHSIPLPLLFDHLEHIPSGSVIPSSNSDYMLHIYNKGRRSFFLNNVKIISPNICTAGSSIRCHGIDGVLAAAEKPLPPPPLATCSNRTGSPDTVRATPPAPLPQPAPPLDEPNYHVPMAAPSSAHQNAGPSTSANECLLKILLTTCFVMSTGFSLL